MKHESLERGRSRRFALTLLLVLLAFALATTAAACGGDDDDDEAAADTTAADTSGDDTGAAAADGSIWVLLPDSASSDRWEKDDRRFFEEAFGEAGVEFNIVNAEGDAGTQLQQAEQAINAGAKVILLVNLSSESGATIIDAARDADVKVVDYDRLTAAGSGADVYVSFDNVKVGQTMADTVGPVIDELGKPEPQVVMMNGGPTDNNSKLFKEGYNETGDFAVSKKVEAGDWEVVADQDVPDWDNQQALTLFEQILVANDNKVDAVFAANDGHRGLRDLGAPVRGRGADPGLRPGRDRERDPEHPRRHADDDRLQADPGRGRGRRAGGDRAPQRRLRRGHLRRRLGGALDQQRRDRPAVPRAHADRGDEGQHRRHGDRGRVPHLGGDLHRRLRAVLPRGPELGRRTARVGAPAPTRPRGDDRPADPHVQGRLEARSARSRRSTRSTSRCARGEVMALVGDNGAGKSTLIKCIAGIYPFDEGDVLFEDRPVTIHSPRDAAAHGIEVVYQDLALADNLDVVANMFLGRERVNGVVLDEPGMERAARETLDGLSVTTLRSVRQAVAGLSGGQRQAVAVAKAVMWNSKVVILDEPTAALGVAQTRQVLDLVRRLADQGLAVVLISHNLHDVFEVADRITVLRLGQSVALLGRADVSQEQVVHAITAGKLTHVPGMVEEAPGAEAPA